MNEYYHTFIKDKLKNDIIKELVNSSEEEGKEIILRTIQEYFDEYTVKLIVEKEKYNIKENKTNLYRDRELYKDREDCCIARVWNCGMGGQCSRKNSINGFCKMHYEKGGEKWWLGTINERRPFNPTNHKGKVHVWLN